MTKKYNEVQIKCMHTRTIFIRTQRVHMVNIFFMLIFHIYIHDDTNLMTHIVFLTFLIELIFRMINIFKSFQAF